MAVSPAFQRFYDNAAPMVAGALPSAVQAALFETLRDFMKATNIWQADVSIPVSPDTNVYPFTIPAGTAAGVASSASPLVEAVIASGASLSAAVDLGPNAIASRVALPLAWTAAGLSFQVSADGITYEELRDDVGNELFLNAGAGYSIALLAAIWRGVRYLKVRSGTLGAPVSQAAARTITITTSAVSSSGPSAGDGLTTGTIASGAAVSGVIDLGIGFVAARLALPAAWTPADLTFLVSTDNVTYNELRDDIGMEVVIPAGSSYSIALLAMIWAGVRYFKIRSGTPGIPVPQADDRTVLVTKVAAPASGGGTAVSRLMNLYNSTDLTKRWFWPASLQLPNTLVLGQAVNNDYTLVATLALFAIDPVDPYGDPIFPSWILDNYFDTLFNGTLWRMYIQPAKPWASAALAATYYKLYRMGRGLAAADVQRRNVFNNQTWCYPGNTVVYGRQRGV